nr:ABC transporter permease [Deinobacterium chartae]
MFSFNDSQYSVAWQGFTTRWYGEMLQNEAILNAVGNTVVLAVSSTVIATLLGTLLAFGLARYRFRAKPLVQSALFLPIITPDIVIALSLLLFYKFVRQYTGLFELGMTTMIIAHVTFQVAFVTVVVRSRLALLDPALEEAARDLYASSWQNFRYVTLPLMTPGILAGALLAFTLSVDDFVISFFTSGTGSTTLPILIYTSVRRGITPDINAISTVIIAVTIVLVFAANYAASRRKPA